MPTIQGNAVAINKIELWLKELLFWLIHKIISDATLFLFQVYYRHFFLKVGLYIKNVRHYFWNFVLQLFVEIIFYVNKYSNYFISKFRENGFLCDWTIATTWN